MLGDQRLDLGQRRTGAGNQHEIGGHIIDHTGEGGHIEPVGVARRADRGLAAAATDLQSTSRG